MPPVREPHEPATIDHVAAPATTLGQTMGDTRLDTGKDEPNLAFTLKTENQQDQSSWPSVPGYEIIGILGRGGMGIVYHARQHGLNRDVALKMVQAGEDDPTHRARFRLEAEAVAQLQHPNIVQIYEIGEVHQQPYFSLEYVAGGSYSRFLQGKPQPPEVTAELVRTLALAVQAAHQCGIIHRDLKPANILLTQTGEPKIADFGLAKYASQASGQTQSGSILGTPSYMAPEQAAGKNDQIVPATDVYALGAILYEALTGRAPFRGASVWDTIHQVLHQEPVPPRSLISTISIDLETICLKCLQKEAGKRYQSAEALAEDLRRYLNHEPIQARPINWLERLWRWRRRNPSLAAALALTTIILIAGICVSSYLAYIANRSAEDARKNLVIADEQTQLAMKTLESVIFEVQDKLAALPNAQKVRGVILQKALADLQNLSEQLRVQQRVDRNTAHASLQLAEAFRQLGKDTGIDSKENTNQLYERATHLFEELHQTAADKLQAKADLANAYLIYSIYLTHLEDWGWEVTAEQGNLQKQRPVMQRALSLARQAIALRREQAAASSDEEAQYQLGRALIEGSYLMMRMNEQTEARISLEEACQVLRPLQHSTNKTQRNQALYAKSVEWLGDWHYDFKSEHRQAEQHYREALAVNKLLAEAKPDDVDTQMAYANSWSRLADAVRAQGDKKGALEAFRQELAITQKLEPLAATNTQLLLDCATSYDHVSNVSLQLQLYEERIVVLKRSYELKTAAIALDPLNHRAHSTLGRTVVRTGVAYNKLGKPQSAIEAYEAGLKFLTDYNAKQNNKNIEQDIQGIQKALDQTRAAMKK
ncbi:MAG: serine/threonine-protein kinase [Gemmatales bacterium]